MPEILKVTNSSIKTIQRCEQQYDYKYVQELSPRRSAIPLTKGTWIHSLLEWKYRVGDWRNQWKKMKRQFDSLFEDEREHYGDLPSWSATILKGYDYHWRNDDEEWTFLETERKLELPLGQNWLYLAKLDVIAENNEGLWIWDHKTFSGKAPNDDYRTADPQSALYDWALECVDGVKPAGFVFNYIRSKVPTIPKLLKNGGLSRAKKIDTNWITLATTLKALGLHSRDYQQELATARARDRGFYDRIFIPKPKSVISNLLKDIQQIVPRIRELHEGRRPTRTLTRDCLRCAYHVLCLTELTGGDGTYIRKNEYVKKAWEEYEEELEGDPE